MSDDASQDGTGDYLPEQYEQATKALDLLYSRILEFDRLGPGSKAVLETVRAEGADKDPEAVGLNALHLAAGMSELAIALVPLRHEEVGKTPAETREYLSQQTFLCATA